MIMIVKAKEVLACTFQISATLTYIFGLRKLTNYVSTSVLLLAKSFTNSWKFFNYMFTHQLTFVEI